MTRNEIEERVENLKFYSNYIDISKISVLQQLNQERQNLRLLKLLKIQNASLLENLNKRWFNKISNIYRPARSNLLFGERKELFILIDPIEIDKYSKVVLNRLEEKMEQEISSTDYVITVGDNVNKLAQRQQLNIIEHMKIESFKNIDGFAEKIGALADVGLKNNVFNHVSLLIAQVDLFTNQIIARKLIPIVANDEELNSDSQDYEYNDEDKMDNREDETFLNLHNEIFAKLDIKTTKWLPNVNTFYEQFSKTIIKQDIFEFKSKSDIEELNKQLQILDEKKRTINEELEELLKSWNRIRKDDMTLQSLLLYSAFKVKKELENDTNKIKNHMKVQRDFALSEFRRKK